MKIRSWQILLASNLLFFGCKSHQGGTNRDFSVGSAAKVQQLFRKSIEYSQISSVYKGPSALLADQASDKRQAESSVVSGNGHYIAFVSMAQLTADAPSQGLKIYRRFVSSEGFGSVELVSKRPAATISSSKCSVSVGAEAANGDSYSPSISADGNKIAFISEASNLAMEVSCDGTSPKAVTATGLSAQVYLIDMTSNKLTLVSGKNVADGNRIADEWPVTDRPAISGDGKIIAFVSRDASLVTKGIAKKDGLNKGILVYNSNNGQTMWVNFLGLSASPSMPDDDSDSPILSYDGRYLLFKSAARLTANDKSDVGVADIYRAEFTMGADGPNERSDLQLVSVDKSGFSVVIAVSATLI